MTDFTRRGFIGAAALSAAALATSGNSFAADPSPPAAPGKTPDFKLGIVTYMIAAEWDLATILNICRSAGVASVELRAGHKHGVSPALSKDQRADVRKQFSDSGTLLWGCGSTCEFQSPDPKIVQKNIDECRQWIDLVADLGGKGVKVRPNGLPAEIPVEKTLDQIGRSLIPCGEAGKPAGVEIWVEVHGKGTAEAKNMRVVMETCGHENVGVTWNSNPEDVKNGSVAESFGLLKKWIRACHINDLYKDATGAYPYRELFVLLRGMGYDRYTMCEVPYSPTKPADGEQFLKYYKALWTELSRETNAR